MKRRLPQRRIERIATGVVIVLIAVAPIAARGVEPTPIAVLTEADFRPFIALPTATPLPIIYEPDRRPVPTRPAVSVPTPPVRVVEAPAAVSGARSLRGLASWYCKPGASICTKGYPAGNCSAAGNWTGCYAAAGPKLRVAICGKTSCTSYKGKKVYVNGVRVTLIDYCQCFWGEPNEKLIDLYHSVYVQTGGNVTITW